MPLDDTLPSNPDIADPTILLCKGIDSIISQFGNYPFLTMPSSFKADNASMEALAFGIRCGIFRVDTDRIFLI